MRDFILLYINGKRHCLSGTLARLSLSEFLRSNLGLTGAKIVCGEGACGACSVLVGTFSESEADALTYQTVNSCLMPLYMLDGCHVVTVEGLAQPKELSPVQTAVVACHGTQCGYCTPGVVVSLTALAENNRGPMDGAAIRDALAGNLCRCTGYLPILEAGLQIAENLDDAAMLADRYPSQPMREELVQAAGQSVLLSAPDLPPVLHARNLSDALAFLARYPDAQITAGGTGAFRTGDDGNTPVLSLGAVAELNRIAVRDNTLFLGATVTWALLGTVAGDHFAELARVVRRFGAPQIRNQGTIGGSVARPDFNGDWLPLLLVQDATVHLASQTEEREVPFAEYLQAGCAPGEVVTAITLPLPRIGERLQTYKVVRRRAFDRSVFCAAVAMERDADGAITSARIACGGIGPVPVRLHQTEAYLHGKPYGLATLQTAGRVAASEITPVSDAYAGAEYRRQLTANLLLRYFHEGAL